MNGDRLENISKIIKSNLKQPIVVEGLNANDFIGATIVSADIDSKELSVIPTAEGYQMPEWIKELREKDSNKQRAILIIDGIDKVDKMQQEKFYELLKFYGVSGLNLPQSTKIILAVENDGFYKLSRKIQSLCLVYRS